MRLMCPGPVLAWPGASCSLFYGFVVELKFNIPPALILAGVTPFFQPATRKERLISFIFV